MDRILQLAEGKTDEARFTAGVWPSKSDTDLAVLSDQRKARAMKRGQLGAALNHYFTTSPTVYRGPAAAVPPVNVMELAL